MAKKPKPVPPTFGEHLRAFRESRGLTQSQLADAAGTTKTTVYRIETSHMEPTWGLALALADALAVSIERFRATALGR